MKIQYFADTDTLHITFSQRTPVETRDLDENTLLDLDHEGQLCSMTIEHAKERVDMPFVEYEQVPA
jgi:uncharacterized protein YuzE